MKSKASFRLRTTRMAAAVCVAALTLTTGLSARAGSDGITPNVQKSDQSFWNQQYMLGDWGGERTKLGQGGRDVRLQ